jgi:hypothetical protein
MVTAGDSPGTVFGVPVMFGIPVMGSVEAGTLVVFGAGSAAADAVGTSGAMVGVTAMVGTATAELIPRLPISVDPIGMPVRATPPGAVGDIGADDAARLLEPAPHMFWVPEVSIRADVAGIPEEDIAVVLCGVTVPVARPPPSNELVDPNIVDGAVPMVEHVVLPIMPAEGSGAGLTPGEAISVAPNGMPVPPTGALGTMPSGDVVESEGVGITPACCAAAWPQRRADAAVIIRKRFMVFSSVVRSARRTRGAKSARHLPGYWGKIGPEDARKTGRCSPNRRPAHAEVCAARLAAAQRQGGVGVQVVPVVAIGITVVSVTVSAEAMQSVLTESEAMRAYVTDAADVAIAEASQMFAAPHAAEMGSAAKASDVATAAKAAAHMTAATEASAAVTATTAATASLGGARHEARGEKSRCQYRDHSFHRDTPFQSDCSAP